MSRIPDPRRGVVRDSSPPASLRAFHFSFRLLGLAAALLLLSAVSERAQALSLINPAATAATAKAGDGLTTQVRGGHGGGGGYGGGRGWSGGSVRSGAAVQSGAIRTGSSFTGSGVRTSGVRFAGHRFGHRHHRRFFVGGYYDDYPYYDDLYYTYPGCRIVVTDYGPRRVCSYRHWRHHHYRRHHHRRQHRVYR